ncbi:uncharacterized protein LOC132751226 [Ruditapes philippinarum]|uniref:uncharacterized protein LOC132751226 n=1 Tax=Ruditapes philippinarum TaxID=129788 RepID=UPI00295B6F1A|nr:uncharacterized protein LOC132751226 [Ruditapes philippinarum]
MALKNMTLKEIAFFVAVLTSVVYTIGGTLCTQNTDCGSGECCYIKPEFEIVSRRRQASILPLQPSQHKQGLCERYRLEHDHCGPLEQANGHCGCGPGLSCQFVPAEVATAQPLVVSKKRKIWVPGPGSFHCKPNA